MNDLTKENIKHIVPAILPKDFAQLSDQISLIADSVNLVQIDVVDGIFAQNKTWPLVGDPDGIFNKMVKQELGMPSWEELDFEIDLMVLDPDFMIDQWIAVGATRIIVHKRALDHRSKTAIEDAPPPQSVIAKEKIKNLSRKVKEKGVEFYLAINPKDDLDESVSLVDELKKEDLLDGVQVMGIENIGFQHQPFSPKSLDIIKMIRKNFPDMIISVDGGVNFDNARVLCDFGANRLVSGSLVFESDMPRDTLELLDQACLPIAIKN